MAGPASASSASAPSFRVSVAANSSLLLVQELGGPRAAPASLYLLLCAGLAAGVALNAAVCAALCWRGTPAGSAHLRLLGQLCAACAADCLLNLPLGALLRAAPRLQAGPLCALSAAAAQAPPLLQAALLAALAAHQAAASRRRAAPGASKQQQQQAPPPGSSSSEARRWRLLLGAAWLYAVAMATPAALDQPRFFLDRLSCGPWRRLGAYSALVLAVGDALPWLVAAAAAADVGRRAAAERRRRRRLRQAAALHRGSGSWLGDADRAATPGAAPGPALGSGALLALVALFLLLGAPAALSAHLAPFLLQVAETLPEGGPEVSRALRTGAHDAVLLWCRYKLALLLPLLVLATQPEARQGCAALFCSCRRPPSGGGGAATLPTVSAAVAASSLLHRVGLRRRKAAQRAHRVASSRTPVLFVTSDGLHVRLAEPTPSAAGDPAFRVAFCDLAIVTAAAPAPRQQRAAVRRPAPAFFFSQPEAERDLHVSDQSQAGAEAEAEAEARRAARAAHGKAVRFRQQVEEIPLAESGVWSDLEPEAHAS